MATRHHVLRLTLHFRRSLSTIGAFREHDVVFLRQHGPKSPRWHISTPLRAGSRVKLSFGRSIDADDLLGRRPLDRVCDSGGQPVILHEPTLANYVLHNSSSRLATPIYPHDANIIVALLDLHPARPGEDDDPDQQSDPRPPFEIFEAGTGMGSLTLHLARAVHAANPSFPSALRRAICAAPAIRDPDVVGAELGTEDQATLDNYRASRRLILHSLDQNVSRVKAAFKFVRHFRRALYLPAVDFHVGTIEAYISLRLLSSSGRPFLSRAVLDVASPHEGAAPVIQALHPGSLLVVFQPSISQIAGFQEWCKRTGQPVLLEKAIELSVTTVVDGHNDAGGGRLWNVKMSIPRADKGAPDKQVQVLRPMVGGQVAGGGFVAVYRRWPAGEMSASVPEEPGEPEDLRGSSTEAEPEEETPSREARVETPPTSTDAEEREVEHDVETSKR
ncbi:hypothetical protein XA68_15833 [Ophiocordyceps unilateralis]|uniref:tRNA (adenine(58)-N(1))-methyltransferase catalytic subunit TRM61 n=1 Tax=Ophiocordyceps unilateralis TaxID=268505 RepID=A0A2A9P7L2_OPHUN|nr:hypothetical protein XA68_15833 [Ophiocordyceps unilateralis]